MPSNSSDASIIANGAITVALLQVLRRNGTLSVEDSAAIFADAKSKSAAQDSVMNREIHTILAVLEARVNS